ncbi:uncharacterized protein LOC132205496 [Neocloeon triangulifer]|uniref:uncharacterized protein LOC132205496 n=1 Tax=Neocloeon triangulifer TaxID=2078957 RepID=UPI00286ECC83|nr:uncharacterized protein LOC132205496 [Neocloeon triangulifer]
MTVPFKSRLVVIFAIWGVGLAMTVNGPDKGGTDSDKEDHHGRENRGLFAPRVEYDEWTPLGHGDPLKNDPTYDYVPPVLERVRYWIEPSAPKKQQTPSSAAPQRPLYGRPPRPPPPTSQYNDGSNAADRRDNHPFLTLVDGPKFNLPPSSPYKQPTPSRPLFTRPPYRPPPPRPSFTTPTPTEATTTTLIPTWSYQTSTTTPPSPVFLTPNAPRFTTSSPTPPPTARPTTAYTTSASLTTDPLFAHYKQPSEPLQGPMYLIIEGHSKVKTYGAGKPANPNAVSESSRRQKRRRRKRRLINSFLKTFL